MSWQLISFAILGAVLISGFVWYERSRPPSQVVALVSALAALAIAGRIAFAALPNVKPTTDIVIFAGYALGGAPGFAVGALSGLVSNFWFGQGPWTPWQMLAWGLCGILGAALALGGRNAGRIRLAAVCGFAGIAYGALLNFSLMATYGGTLSWKYFLTLEARAVPFEAAHAGGNIILALIAGPALVRMLIRFRQRFEWRSSGPGSGEGGARDSGRGGRLSPRLGSGGVAALALLSLALLSTLPAHAQASSVGRAASWLESVQNSDGGFADTPGAGSGTEMTGWAMLGLEAAGRNPLDVSRGGNTPVSFIRSHSGQVQGAGDLARTIIALEGAGVNARSFAGRDLVGELLNERGKDGSFEGHPALTAYAIVALRTAGATGGLQQSVSWLIGAQNKDGGWGESKSISTADETGAAMQAIPGTNAARNGLKYLRNAQRPGGGFALEEGGAANTQSSAWAIQGIVALGGDPGSFRRGGASALDYLDAQQASNGHYRYSASSDRTPIWVTGEVLVAAAGKSLPLEVPARAPRPKPAPAPKALAPAPAPLPAAPASPPPAAPAGRPPIQAGAPGPREGAGSSSGGAGSSSGSLPPSASSGLGVPGAGLPPAGGGLGEPATPTQSGTLASTSFQPPHQSPGIPLAIGAALTAAIVAATRWLGRRKGW